MLRALRVLGLIEGCSFLVLLLIAMPMKYIGHNPAPVKIVGSTHGGLTVLYLLLGFVVGAGLKWPIKRFVALVIAASLPLGTFVFDGLLKREEARLPTSSA